MSRACVFLFRQEEPMDPGSRLLAAARAYLAQKDSPVPPERLDAGRDGKSPGEEWQVVKTGRGKPYFLRRPQLRFSISHSEEWWGCAFLESEIGLDIQKHTRFRHESWEEADRRLGRMAERFFHPREAAYVDGRHARFFRIWAAKESYVKYTGQGIGDDFGEFSVLPEEMEGALPLRWRGAGACFHEIEYPEAYTICVCAEKERECALYTCTGPAFRRQSIF